MAVTRIWTRVLARTDRPAAIAFWLMVAHVPFGLAAAAGLPARRLAVLARAGSRSWCLGVGNGSAHFLFARAFALAPVGVLAPFEYSTLVMGTMRRRAGLGRRAGLEHAGGGRDRGGGGALQPSPRADPGAGGAGRRVRAGLMVLRHDMRRGALLMLGATACFAVMGAIVKVLSARHAFLELMFFRNALSLPIVLAAGLRTGALLRTRRLGGHAVRARSRG